jgi:hypothetical protein
MIESLLALLLVLSSANVSPDVTGTIHGVVLNGSRGNAPIANTSVVLRAGQGELLEPVAETRTDENGKFAFTEVPLDPTIVFLPGAERDGVHYPAKRLRLSRPNPNAEVVIEAFDAIQSPSPLLALRHEIEVTVEPRVLLVSETMLVANRSDRAYVGESSGQDPPVTLRLSVPANFDRVTFGSEFYGRRFRIVEHRPVTDIPWPPGERELKFTYRIPLEGSGGLFRRPLDIPSKKISLRVRGADAKSVSCNLPPKHKLGNDVNFAPAAQQLPAGHVLELQIGTLPFPWAFYARWSAVTMLSALVIGTVTIGRFRNRQSLGPRCSEFQGRRSNFQRKKSRRVA